MKDDRRNAWTGHTRNDTFLNGALIAAGIAGLLLALIGDPVPEFSRPAQMIAASGVVLSE